MRQQPTNPAFGAQPHLVPRQVEGGFWMLYHLQFQQLLDDFGWFQSRGDAAAKIAELQRVTTPARYGSHAPTRDGMN